MKEINKDMFKDMKTIAIYGNCGSGKTALAYSLINMLKGSDKKVYFLKHPKPELIEELGYFNLESLEMIEKLQDCIIYLDEPQLILSIQTKKSNKIISQVCSLARQLNITLIISSSDTRVFTKSNEAYFDLWCVKDLDFAMIKNGSKIKDILRKNARFDPAGLRLEDSEYLVECRRHPEINGKHVFELPTYFTEAHSKPFRTANKTPSQSANQNANQTTLQIANENNLIPKKPLQNCESNTEKPSQLDSGAVPREIASEITLQQSK